MSSKRFFILGLACGALSSFVVFVSADADARSIEQCLTSTSDAEEIDCLYALIERRMGEGGITEAMHLFQRVYEMSDVFSRTGCHRHAHKVGDMAYYRFYVPTRDITMLEMGGETGACGYGFFHGLMEHVAQERPDPVFVRTICEYLDATLGSELGDIRPICYHGSGHGFMLRHVEDLPVEAWGDVGRFVAEPLMQCAALENVTRREREECEEGIYNVIVDWMETRQFGFEYDFDAPFAVCDQAAEQSHRSACYYEMAMKLTAVADSSPQKLASLIEPIGDEETRLRVFRVGVSGMIQSISGTEEYPEMVAKCLLLERIYVWPCVESVVHGLFEHGTPGKEYQKPLLVCSSAPIEAHGLRQKCFEHLNSRLPRFYDAETRSGICREFPTDMQALCTG